MNEIKNIELTKYLIYNDKLDTTLNEIEKEIFKAKSVHTDDFNSSHEAYAVILEELDELWDEIKKKEHDKVKMREEAIQCAAMLCRLLVEIL